jgi:hypothetical protein
MWDEGKSLGSRSPLTRRHTMKGNGIENKTFQKGKNPDNSKARVLNPKKFC